MDANKANEMLRDIHHSSFPTKLLSCELELLSPQELGNILVKTNWTWKDEEYASKIVAMGADLDYGDMDAIVKKIRGCVAFKDTFYLKFLIDKGFYNQYTTFMDTLSYILYKYRFTLYGDVEIVKTFIDHGKIHGFNHEPEGEEHFVAYAANEDNYELVKLFVEAGYKIKLGGLYKNISARFLINHPLKQAMRNKNYKMIKLLIINGSLDIREIWNDFISITHNLNINCWVILCSLLRVLRNTSLWLIKGLKK